jgi:phosphomevalonate kinase
MPFTEGVFAQGVMEDSLDYVLWEKDRRLKYEDFKGVQDTTFLVYGYPANGAAVTKIITSFARHENDKLTFSVDNKFLKTKSWIVNRKPVVLSHEQGHFDISEIYARKIRRALTVLLKAQSVEELILTQTVNSLLKELNRYQERYDEETHHGFILEKQKTWEEKIKKELDDLERFS